MESLDQTEASLEIASTRKHLRAKLRDIELNSFNNPRLPSIKKTKKFVNLSTVPETPTSKQASSVSPTRFPSIFKKYSQF